MYSVQCLDVACILSCYMLNVCMLLDTCRYASNDCECTEIMYYVWTYNVLKYGDILKF